MKQMSLGTLTEDETSLIHLGGAERDEEVEALRKQVVSLSAQLEIALHQQYPRNECRTNSTKRPYHPLSPHAFNVREVRTSTNKPTITAQREKLGRTASISTRQVLDNLPDSDVVGNPPVIQRILDMFQRPSSHMEYLNSELFCKDILKLAMKVKGMFEREPRVVFLQSPAYVFGDIHGNLEDLHFFSDNVWRLGMSLTAGSFLFLGDYVDRGLHCLECVAYLFAMKLQLPNKVFLLRGNHETRDINGWEEHYGERSFMYQCRKRFGDSAGYRVWEACNQAFDRMPLAGVIDQDIFCVHGGIPRPVSSNPGATRIQDILAVPKVSGINPPYEHEDDKYQQVASDCVWSDPATEEQEMTSVDPDTGFGESRRGGGAICFGNKAVSNFLQQHDFSYIMRAHEAHAEGVAVSKEARVFTVFSTSQDHNQGSQAMAGCILVDNNRLQVINRSPAYKNQYVHRRDSISLAAMPETEIEQRMKLGLVTSSSEDAGDGQDDDGDIEDWQDLEDDDSDDKAQGALEGDYSFDKNRRSSIDLAGISNIRDDASWASDASAASFTSFTEFESNKRHRSKRPGFAPIHEAEADEDVDTLDGDEDEMELRAERERS
uniref:Serine/threonine-protein phosphatase n=2 Tax=Amphora coffeiformis TaxID=265554 RepID=A0A7S3LD81_9STRA|mmetsp:Transcript_8311/g.16077  ORF Transcript_8311/g.16077 Transcript_8311/m.16077 type:complete len:604 (-) Transcript_8311:34-1845(-)